MIGSNLLQNIYTKAMGLVVGYARVSTDKQALTHSLEHQKARLQASGIDVIYYDVDSGKNSSREEFDKVLTQVAS